MSKRYEEKGHKPPLRSAVKKTTNGGRKLPVRFFQLGKRDRAALRRLLRALRDPLRQHL